MRKAITGKNMAKQEAHAILDDEAKELVVSNSEIKRVTLRTRTSYFNTFTRADLLKY